MKIKKKIIKSISKEIQPRVMWTFLMFITSQFIFAQVQVVKRKIIDSQGLSISGASLKIQGTSTGTI